MASLNGQVPSEELELLNTWLYWLAYIAPEAITRIKGYQRFQNTQNANGLASLLMDFTHILAFLLWLIANYIVRGRQDFLKYLRYGAISVTVLFVVALVGVIVAGFF